MIEKKKKRLVIIYIIAVVLLLIFLHFLGILNKLEDFTLDKLNFSQGQTYTFLTKLKYSFVNYQEAKDLKKTNLQLQDEVNRLIYENSELKILEQENQELKKQLGFYETNNYQYLLARVIGKDMQRNNTLIINKGKNDGLAIGQPVIINEGIIIGKIIEVKNDLATVLLLTDKLSQLAISLPTQEKTIGLAEGEFGLSIKVEFIPQDIEINADDVVISSGLEPLIPKGLVIGKVNRIISNENDLFKSVTITPLTDYEEITLVSVIITQLPGND